MNYSFSGTFKAGTIEAMEKRALQVGGKVTKSITEATTSLVLGPDQAEGSEAAEARESGIDVWDEEKFFSIIGPDIGVPQSPQAVPKPKRKIPLDLSDRADENAANAAEGKRGKRAKKEKAPDEGLNEAAGSPAHKKGRGRPKKEKA